MRGLLARSRRVGALPLLLLAPVTGCVAMDDPAVRVGRGALALDAFCEAEVLGSGLLDVENDYLPQVVACENGAAADEALAAQAVAARSFLYYKLAREGAIGDGEGDQVYSCGNPAGERHRRAVEATSGLVLGYRGALVAAFYVAGALQDPPGCTGGVDDPTDTEVFVTYNDGRSGADVEQTTLGFIDPDNFENRGCQSQNGANCLAQAGRGHASILRFYYGEDIEIFRAEGPCVIAPDDPGDGGGDGDPVDDGDPDDGDPADDGDPVDDGAGDPGLAGGGGCSAAAGDLAPGGSLAGLAPALLVGLWLSRSVRGRAAPAGRPSPRASRRRRGRRRG